MTGIKDLRLNILITLGLFIFTPKLLFGLHSDNISLALVICSLGFSAEKYECKSLHVNLFFTFLMLYPYI